MLTIVLTNRNKPAKTLARCLASLASQTTDAFKVVVVDYGSTQNGKTSLEKAIKSLERIECIYCPTQHRLWNKSRAINIALAQCDTPFFFVGDVDMIFHHEFVHTALSLANETVTYFQAGFLSEAETKHDKDFSDYTIDFTSTPHATGMTLYPTDLLKRIGGYDEFYHGWGAEDTDVHMRLKNKDVPIAFYDKKILMLHQWHEKHYRTSSNKYPFHSYQERVNQAYLKLVERTKKTIANTTMDWGALPKALKGAPDDSITIDSTYDNLSAVLATIDSMSDTLIRLNIVPHPDAHSTKQRVKHMLGKKTPLFCSLEAANDHLLSWIIRYHRDKDYEFLFDENPKRIQLTIQL